jgi:hypothetical protein
MVLNTIDMRTQPIEVLDSGEGPFWYAMYGLRVRSDQRVPLARPTSVDGEPAAWAVSHAGPGQPVPQPDEPLVAEVRCHPQCQGPVFVRVHAGRSGAWLWDRSIATFHVSPDARRVLVYPHPGVDERLLGLALAGQVSVFVLHKLGYPTLHASAVVAAHGAVGFLGAKGQGKSTAAANFLQHGATLLTDDALPLWLLDDGVYGAPGLPHMKLWPETVEHALNLPSDLPSLLPSYDKRLFVVHGHYPFADRPAPLRALYVLKAYDPVSVGRTEITIHQLSKRDALGVLVAQTSWLRLLAQTEAAGLLRSYAGVVAQVPVRLLSFPGGFEHQEAVHTRIMADLEEI